MGAGDVAQQFREVAAVSEDPGSIPSTRMVAHSRLKLQSQRT